MAQDQEGAADDSRLLDIDRRSLLQMTGAAAGAGLLGSASVGTAAAQQDEIDERIQEHRTGDVEITVQDDSGNAVPEATVEIEQQEHDFAFGTAIHSEFLTKGTEWGENISYDGQTLDSEDQDKYRETIKELFNTVVLENLHKWYLWEDNTQIADDAVDWCVENDIDVRGHVCIWGNLEAYALPPRVVEAMGDPWATEWSEAGQPDRDVDTVKEEASDHIDEIINHYGSDIKVWEVVNEVLHKPSIIEAIEGEDVDPETAPILGDWYEQAEETAGEYDVPVAINDYNVMAESNYTEPDTYEDQMDYLVNERGVDLDGGIGMQCHFSKEERKDSDEIMETLDRYAEYGPLNTTEFDLFVNGWEEDEEAEYLETYLRTFFSHPDANEFLVWGHWTPLHWGDDYGGSESPQNAPFFRGDWTEKPGLEVYRDLVFDEWWTEEDGTADDSGLYETNAFLGTHEITVSADGESNTETVEVTDSDDVTTVEISLDGDIETPDDGTPDEETPEEGPDPVDDTVPGDLDDDGLHEDFNDNGELDFPDVNAFFQNTDSSAVTDNTEYYDFNDDGEISLQDVMELFQQV